MRTGHVMKMVILLCTKFGVHGLFECVWPLGKGFVLWTRMGSTLPVDFIHRHSRMAGDKEIPRFRGLFH